MSRRHKIAIKILLWIVRYLLSDLEDIDQKEELKKLSTHISVNMELIGEQ